MTDRQLILRAITTVRRRWRLNIFLRGAAIVLGAGLALLLVSTLAMDRFHFTDTSVLVFRIVTYGGLAFLTVRYLILPLLRRVSNEQVALYLEEHEPSMQATLLSAVEMSQAHKKDGAGAEPSQLISHLIATAVDRCRQVQFGKRIEERSLYRSSGTLAGLVVAATAVMLLSPGFLRHGMPYLLFLGGGGPDNPYTISVSPGDTLLARGADQIVTSMLNGFDAERVEVVVKRGEEGEWKRWPMVPSENAGYEIFLFDLNEATDYYVQASGVRSAIHRIEVADLPYVDQIDLEYTFPGYSGLSPRLEEDGGDIAALQGTNVKLMIRPTIPTPGGRLVLDGADPVPLIVESDGTLSVTIQIEDDGYYRIQLEGVNERLVPASPDFTIDVLEDLPPSVTFEKPGHDIKATSVEETFLQVKAEDDYGIGRLDLFVSVNGGAMDTIPLYGGGRKTDLSAGHTFYLEEMDLEPGDLISYYASVRDNNRAADQTATTDIYFIEVRPFRLDYRQAEQGGQQGGGGGGADDLGGSLSTQQRQVVAATFKVMRDRKQFSPAELRENAATLALSQGRVRERVQAIVQRLNDRGIVQSDSGFRKVVEELPKAMEQMELAEEEFGRRDAEAALAPAQKALQHLQRAEAAFRDVQLSMSGGGGGGGGGSPSEAEDLADLFELELDKLRNQYESVQRGQQEAVDNEVDATMQRLRDLARRQQQENERLRERASRMQQGQAGGGGQSQRRLAEETEELARELQRLSREQSLPKLEDTARRLQEAANAMRRAAAGERTGNLSEGKSALDELRDARRLLERNQSARLERDLDEALNRAERLRQEQSDIAGAVQGLPNQSDRAERVRRLQERKEGMAAEIGDLERELDDIARESRKDQPEASSRLQEAAGSIRKNRLAEKVRYSRGVIESRSPDYASNFEGQITENLGELRDRIQQAADAVGDGDAQAGLDDALEQARDLVRGLESMGERLGERLEGPQPQGQPGQEGQPQEGKPGQEGQEGQQGEEGQEGQQGQQGQGGQSGFAPGGNGNPFSPGRLSPDERRQFGREFRERRGEAERLREGLREMGVDTQDMNQILRRLRELEQSDVYSDAEEVRRLQTAVLEGLKEFEYALRRSLASDDEGELLLTGSADVPREYREMVEEYYRELSRRGNRR